MARKLKEEVETPASGNSKNTLKSLQDAILKKCKGVHASFMNGSELAKRDEYIKTPSYDLNRVLTGDLCKGIFMRTLRTCSTVRNIHLSHLLLPFVLLMHRKKVIKLLL